MPRRHTDNTSLSRRTLLKGLGLSPLLLRPSPLHGYGLLFGPSAPLPDAALALADVRLIPHYPERSPLEAVLRLVAPGSDDYITEKYAWEIESLLRGWSAVLKASPRDLSAPAALLDDSFAGAALDSARETTLRDAYGIECLRRDSAGAAAGGRERFLRGMEAWLAAYARIDTAEFQITGIEEMANEPLRLGIEIRYEIAGTRRDGRREARVGSWRTEWRQDGAKWRATRWLPAGETVSRCAGPGFVDVTAQALGGAASYREQMLRGADYWRTVLDGACGIDVYGNNGIAAGDFDNDGFDDLYICQPAGLPNRLYRNRGDGTFEDVTERAGVGVLDNTACALFADFRNAGLQDLLVVCGGGPLLFLNRGDGRFEIKRDAFQFARAPEGSFTHAAVADYDRDGRLDIYFCLYSYYLGLDQYHYPAPYFDARNGPANFLLRNQGDGVFVDRTEAAGLNAENDRYSFACAWGDSGAGPGPDLYVANDFGRANLYRNNGDGIFTAVSGAAHVDDAGAGMSAAWCDTDNDGRQDIYAANMWSAAGQRVSEQKIFHPDSSPEVLAEYRRHARGNSLFRNLGGGGFENVSRRAGVEMGRWSWCSDFWDFDRDGYPDLYVANGYISAPQREDLASFFWRQVVGKSPDDATPSAAYERGWQALNELIRSDSTWNGYERNVMYANNGDGSFSDLSGALGLDLPEDGRSFALADIDGDGRLEAIVKNRNAPQLRILRNAMEHVGNAISFRLRGQRSNRDGIGAAVTVAAGKLRQTKYLQAGSGFLAQHSKELFFGVGPETGDLSASIRWPSGLVQELKALPANHRITVEEGAAEFAAKAFAAAPAAYAKAGPAPQPETLPERVETWLIEPLPAPEFSLPDVNGRQRTLKEFRGSPVLLSFWATSAPASEEQLRRLQRHGGVTVLAINLDAAADAGKARSFAARERLSFPALFATEQVAGVYNIVYRYLYDRRRDLGIPAGFLLDRDGMIVKVYQGAFDPARLNADAKAIPTTAAERLRKALPFPGVLHQGEFTRNDFTYGVAMFQHGYFDEAAASFRQVIAAKPDDAEGYYNLGTLSLRRNDYPEARRYLEQTLKLRPNYPEAWNNLGLIAAQQGDAAQAIANFRQSLVLRPNYAVALLNLGNLYRRQGEYDKAQECLNRALALQPDDAETNYSLGMFYAQQNRLPRAAEFLEKAVALRPDYPEARNNLGVLFVREQEYAQAEEQFQSAIRASPNFDQSYLNLARLYALEDQKEKAKSVVEDLLRLQPENAKARKALEQLNAMP